MRTFFLCLKRDIPEGSYITIRHGSGPGFVVKNEKGKFTAAPNKCPHRGFRITEACGLLPVKCQYHGLQFMFEDPLKVHSIGEMLFTGDMTEFSSDIKFLSIDLGKEFGACTQNVKAPFHLWVQNTADPNHLKTVHKNFFNLFESTEVREVNIQDNWSSYRMDVKQEIKSKYEKYQRSIAHIFENDFYHEIFYPNLSVTSFLGLFHSVETAHPVNEGECEIRTRFFISSAAVVPSMLCKLALDSNIKILQEDKELIEALAINYEGFEPFTVRMAGEERIRAYTETMVKWGLA